MTSVKATSLWSGKDSALASPSSWLNSVSDGASTIIEQYGIRLLLGWQCFHWKNTMLKWQRKIQFQLPSNMPSGCFRIEAIIISFCIAFRTFSTRTIIWLIKGFMGANRLEHWKYNNVKNLPWYQCHHVSVEIPLIHSNCNLWTQNNELIMNIRSNFPFLTNDPSFTNDPWVKWSNDPSFMI